MRGAAATVAQRVVIRCRWGHGVALAPGFSGCRMHRAYATLKGMNNARVRLGELLVQAQIIDAEQLDQEVRRFLSEVRAA